MLKSISPIILSVFFISCSSGKNELPDSEIQVEKVELNLVHGDLLLTRMGYDKAINKDSLLVYDDENYQFVIFDIQSKEPVWTLKLQPDGPNFLETPVSDAWYNSDKLYVLSKNYFSIYDANKGLLITRLSALDIKGWNEGYHLSSFVYQPEENILFVKQSMASIAPSYGVDDPTNSIVYRYSLTTKKLDSLKINNPSETLAYDPDQGYYTNYSEPYLQTRGDSLIFSFEFGSNIYLYTEAEQRVQTIAAPSEYSAPFREPENRNSYENNRVEYIYSGPKYFSVSPLGGTSLFARSHGDYIKMPDGKNKRVRYLTILDKQFQVVKEIEIDERVWDDPFVMGNTVFFIKLDRLMEDHFELIGDKIQEN